jgi:hypothetical protein
MSAKYCHHHQKTMQNADKHRKLSPVTALRLSVVKPSDNEAFIIKGLWNMIHESAE